jgi:uncharacterized membrane protein (DUF485 family)
MSAVTAYDWAAIVANPRFHELHSRKSRFLWGLMVFSVVYSFLLPIGAAYFQALSEFIVAWGVAYYYSRRANREFDALAQEIIREAGRMGGRP